MWFSCLAPRDSHTFPHALPAFPSVSESVLCHFWPQLQQPLLKVHQAPWMVPLSISQHLLTLGLKTQNCYIPLLLKPSSGSMLSMNKGSKIPQNPLNPLGTSLLTQELFHLLSSPQTCSQFYSLLPFPRSFIFHDHRTMSVSSTLDSAQRS